MYQIPNSPQIFIEIKRLIESVYIDFTDDFDIFENDIFILFDPLDGIEEIDDEEDINTDTYDEEPPELNIIPPAVSNEYEELIDSAIDGLSDDDCDEDPDCDHECEESDPFNIFMPFDSGMLNKNKMHTSNFEPFNTEENDTETPNFVHKPTNLKLWWKLGDDAIYSNQVLNYRKITTIVNQCVVSLGRMTKNFIVRYQYWGDDGDVKM